MIHKHYTIPHTLSLEILSPNITIELCFVVYLHCCQSPVGSTADLERRFTLQ